MTENIQKRILELREILNKANYDYYVLETPTISDFQFDEFYRELIQLESEHPELVTSDSPTQRVGNKVGKENKPHINNLSMEEMKSSTIGDDYKKIIGSMSEDIEKVRNLQQEINDGSHGFVKQAIDQDIDQKNEIALIKKSQESASDLADIANSLQQSFEKQVLGEIKRLEEMQTKHVELIRNISERFNLGKAIKELYNTVSKINSISDFESISSIAQSVYEEIKFPTEALKLLNASNILKYDKNSLLEFRNFKLEALEEALRPSDYFERLTESLRDIKFSNINNELEELHQDTKKMKHLEDRIHEANHYYYVLEDPLMSDYEYDKLFQELQNLEEKYPSYISPNTPTQRVGSGRTSTFEEIPFNKPMLSLGNAFSKEDIMKFDDRIKKQIVDFSYITEPKLDGLAISLSYRKGVFVLGLTRGDGEFGENITENLKTVRAIPMKLQDNFPRVLEVRGELVMSKDEFIRFNKERLSNGLSEFANPRNAASGSIRQLDPNETAKRKLDFFAYRASENIADTQNQVLLKLSKLGFKVVPLHRHAETIETVWEQILDIEQKKDGFPFGTDGAVVKIEELEFHDILGATSHEPRWAIAYKFPPDEKQTIVTNIVLSVGRTGAITPVAEFEPVLLEGSTIARASLHNEDEVERLDIRVGDTIIVRKAGSVIPEVVRVITTNRTGNEKKFFMPEKCPVCGSETIREEDSAFIKCTNFSCPAQVKERILFFLARGNADIDGLGEVMIESLVDSGILKDVADIFELTHDNLFTVERMGDVLADKILKNISIGKNLGLTRFLSGLGIPMVGKVASKLLAQKFGSIDKIISSNLIELENIEGVGPKIANSVKDFFVKPHNQELILRLKKIGLKMTEEIIQISSTSVFSGKRIVLTGTLQTMSRQEAKDKLESLGAKVSSSVSKKTDYIVVGNDPGSKAKKAEEFGVKILSENEFLEMIS